MGEDFEVDMCPRCKSRRVEATWDFVEGIRIHLKCLDCNYVEAINQNPNPDPEPSDEGNPWQTDPDWWKTEEAPD